MTGSQITWIAVGAAITGAIVAVLFDPDLRAALNRPPARARFSPPRLDDQQNKAINDMIGSGMLRLDEDARSAWIDPLAWAMVDVQKKEQIAGLLAARIRDRTGTNRVQIYDKMSGKKLATYSGAWGFSVE